MGAGAREPWRGDGPGTTSSGPTIISTSQVVPRWDERADSLEHAVVVDHGLIAAKPLGDLLRRERGTWQAVRALEAEQVVAGVAELTDDGARAAIHVGAGCAPSDRR